MPKHKVLLRQLKRYQLDENVCPTSLQQWQKFLERINLAYIELDQDRYLSSRAQEISSKEMQNLYDALQEAQTIAHIGSWSLDWETKKIQLSKEAYRILDLDISKPPPEYEAIVQLIDQEDYTHLKKLIERAIKWGESYEAELKIYTSKNFRWIFVTGKPTINRDNKLTGTILDITNRKKAEEREMLLNKELVRAARQMGMAEVATSVLHNVGNVLNSVNVSAILIVEKLKMTKMTNLRKITELCQANANNITDFLTHDPKGKHVLSYLEKLADYWDDEQAALLQELRSLEKNIEHIKAIVQTQQSISRTVGLVEPSFPVDIFEDALKIYSDAFKKSDISIIKDYGFNEKIQVDKNKLHQIIINLILNARDAVLSDINEAPKITLRTFSKNDSVILQVIDNGIGIPQENLPRLFSYGFTTKKNGHGFGLYSSALTAKEMHGKLMAESAGINKGATFTLELPKNNKT